MSSQQFNSFGGGSAAQASSSDFTSLEKPVTYTCGDCASDVTLKKADPLRCLQCGHRILHKKRTAKLVASSLTYSSTSVNGMQSRMVQFEAR